MQTIFDLKEQAVTDTPLLVFDCALPDGRTETVEHARVTVGGATYEARVLQHNVFEMQTASDQGMDGVPKISMVLANADSHFSEIERSGGWKGARLTVGFLFYDLRNDAPLTETVGGVPGDLQPAGRDPRGDVPADGDEPDEPADGCCCRRCGSSGGARGNFPATAEQRTEAVDGGANGKYSRYYRCGYSAGVTGGAGSLNGGAPFAACGYTRQDCQARGMLPHFGGNGVRAAGDRGAQLRRKSWSTLGGVGEPGAVQRLRSDGVRHGVVHSRRWCSRATTAT